MEGKNDNVGGFRALVLVEFVDEFGSLEIDIGARIGLCSFVEGVWDVDVTLDRFAA